MSFPSTTATVTCQPLVPKTITRRQLRRPESRTDQDQYKQAGEIGRALELYEGAVDQLRRLLAGGDPTAVILVSNFAFTCHSTGDVARAIELYGEALAGSLRISGRTHADTLTLIGVLAVAYYDQGDTVRAVQLLERGFADSRQALGDDHPITVTIAANLATARRSL